MVGFRDIVCHNASLVLDFPTPRIDKLSFKKLNLDRNLVENLDSSNMSSNQPHFYWENFTKKYFKKI
jgi:hypothetical protein